MDNLIHRGEVQPMVVLMPNAAGYAASANEQLHRTDLVERVFPWVEQHFHVSTAVSDRAYSGLSAGGMRTVHLLLNNTAQFGYYGVMSAGLPAGTTFSDELKTAMRKVSVFVGGGWQDPINQGYLTHHRGPLRAVRDLTGASVHVQSDFIDGGHEWYVWRILLRDFLTRVAFLPQTTATADWGA